VSTATCCGLTEQHLIIIIIMLPNQAIASPDVREKLAWMGLNVPGNGGYMLSWRDASVQMQQNRNRNSIDSMHKHDSHACCC
jgi:hypothetical protein